MDYNLSGKTALVTGGSRGIGLETVRLLAEEGVEVLVCARRHSALLEAAADVKATTGKAVQIHPIDVASAEDISRIPEVIRQTLGGIDLLVNNAGTGTYKPFMAVTDEELEYGMAVNFFAQFRMCQRTIPLMLENGGGRIVNVTGESGIRVFNPPFLSSCTGPAKSAENRFSKILANEYADQNIRVNAVVPGFVDSPERVGKWNTELADGQLRTSDAVRERQDEWAKLQGMRNTRWAQPEEIARLIVFALSDAASYVNGAVLIADGALDKG